MSGREYVINKRLMKLQMRFDSHTACQAIVREQLSRLGIDFQIHGMSELEILQPLEMDEQRVLRLSLQPYGIEFIEDPNYILVQKVRDLVIEMINTPENPSRFSDYLTKKLNHSYGHIAKVFSEFTFNSIENYIILQKIDKAKQLIAEKQLTLTEIAWRLHYSSVQHLSTQFKKTTGITPSAFQRIIQERRQRLNQPFEITSIPI